MCGFFMRLTWDSRSPSSHPVSSYGNFPLEPSAGELGRAWDPLQLISLLMGFYPSHLGVGPARSMCLPLLIVYVASSVHL